MLKKIFLFLLVGLIVIVGAVFYFGSKSNNKSDEQFYAQKGVDGPWTGNLSILFSSDGTTFGQPQLFIKHAGVPSIIKMTDGTLLSAFQWFPANEEEFDKIAVSISYDDGQSWTNPELIKIDGYPSNLSRPFDPTVTLTEDGKVRLYFTANIGGKIINSQTAIYSAISNDGIHYTFEDGIRFRSSVSSQTIDSAEVLFKDVWHILTPHMPNLGANHATSTDGLEFKDQPLISSRNINWTGNLVVDNDEMRFYGSGQNGIWWKSTKDGFTWNAPIETNIFGGDPAVAKKSDGGFVLIIVAR